MSKGTRQGLGISETQRSRETAGDSPSPLLTFEGDGERLFGGSWGG